jgi:hypothetical protein
MRRAVPIALQQVKRNSLCRLLTDAWHAAQCVNQLDE